MDQSHRLPDTIGWTEPMGGWLIIRGSPLTPQGKERPLEIEKSAEAMRHKDKIGSGFDQLLKKI